MFHGGCSPWIQSVKKSELRMTNLFGNLNSEGLEKTKDVTGGGFTLETGVYQGKVKVAYAGKSAQGAASVTVIFVSDSGKELRETVYVTSRTGQNYYHPKNKDGSRDTTKKVPLPGFTIIDDLCLAITGKPLCEQSTEEKVVKMWDKDAKAELPKNVQVLDELTEGVVTLAIWKNLENKSEQRGDVFVPIADTRDTNNIEKVIHTESGMTIVEARDNLDATFAKTWGEKNTGITRDKREIKDGAGAAGAPTKPVGGAPAADAGGAPRKSLFDKKS